MLRRIPRSSPAGERPLGLLAELTYRCPLGLPVLLESNNVAAQRERIDDAGVGAGHPGSREIWACCTFISRAANRSCIPDCRRSWRTARAAGLYTNLITSGIPFSRETAEALLSAGLDHVQLSLQSDEAPLADQIAGRRSHAAKLEAARLIRELGWPLTLNVVLHRANIDRLPQLIELAEELDADRLELANVQFYGWAHHNRDSLLPDLGALSEAAAYVAQARGRLKGRLRLDYVLPDALGRSAETVHGGLGTTLSHGQSPGGRPSLPDRLLHRIAAFRQREAAGRSAGSGRSRTRSIASAARPGCPNPAAAASGDTPISAAAAARPLCSRETRPTPIPLASFRRTARS